MAVGPGIDARWLILFALLVLSASQYWLTGLTLEVSRNYLIEVRVVQTFAMGFFFVPVQSAAYMYLPQDQINNATGMVSMVRNEGASLGVALLNTLLARRTQFHLARLAGGINPLQPATTAAIAQAAQVAQAAGANPDMAHQQAVAIIGNALQQQAAFMAYLDAFMVFSVMALAAVPLLLVMRRSVTEGPPPPGHV